MTQNDYLAPIAARLTYNGAATLRATIENPSAIEPDAIGGRERVFTGLGKWTSLAAQAVRRHLCGLGLAEMVWTGTYWHQNREEHQKNMRCRITPLGREVAAYLSAHWDELSFRSTR